MAKSARFSPKEMVKVGFDRAIEAQYPLAADNVARLRRIHPEKSPEQLIGYINKLYLSTVSATGGGAGAAAAVPNGAVQVPAALADLVMFLEASVLYTLTMAEIQGLHAEDIERRRLLVLAVLVGEGASSAVLDSLAARTAPYWGRQIVKAIPYPAVLKANKVLGKNFITKYGARQGILVLSTQIPFFIGAGIGAGGNALFGWFIVRASRKILGPPPASWADDRAGNSESVVSTEQVAPLNSQERK